MSKRLPEEKVKNIAFEKGIVLLSNDYFDARNQYLWWRCKIGHDWEATFQSVRKGGCPYCADKPPQFIEQLTQFALNKKGKCLSDVYINARTNYLWECECGYQWKATWDNIKNKKKWCPKCAGRPIVHIEEVRAWANQHNGKLLSEKYINASSLLFWECNKCGNKWFANYNNIKSKDSWCPECSSSKNQKKVFEIISNIFTRSTCFFDYHGFRWLGRQEIDIFIQEQKIAIEYDGQQHYLSVKSWGGEIALEKNKKRDARKNKLISEHPEDIKYFIRIPYWEPVTEENVKRILKENGVNF